MNATPHTPASSDDGARCELLRQVLARRGVDLSGLDTSGGLPTDALVAAGRLSPQAANQLLEEVLGVRAIDPTIVSLSPLFLEHARRLLPRALVEQDQVFPIRHERDQLHLVMARPWDAQALRRAQCASGSRVAAYVSCAALIQEALRVYYGEAPTAPSLQESTPETCIREAAEAVNQLRMAQAGLLEQINCAAVVRLVQKTLDELARQGASDIHFEPRLDRMVVRARLDGAMRTVWTLPPSLREPVSARCKLMANMNLDITTRPQDGAVDYHVILDRDMDIRVSALPCMHGEKLVLRLLDKGKGRLRLADLGFNPRELDQVESAMNRVSGMILATGPTGGGKTTTLYAILGECNTDDVNIVTAEDPIEYKVDGLTQVSCSADSDTSFADALRSFLRQDPDVIMIGEIRDAETADFAVKAAMTGHLVLSTLHTNDAASAVNRLVNMGVEPYLVASVGLTVIGQRLVRRICPHCKTEDDPARRDRLAPLAGAPVSMPIWRGAGCEHCGGTGFRGRVGVYEVLSVTEALEPLILGRAPAGELKRAAVAQGMTTLARSALARVAAGETTVDEALRAAMAD